MSRHPSLASSRPSRRAWKHLSADRKRELPAITNWRGPTDRHGSLAAAYDSDGVVQAHAGRSTVALQRRAEAEHVGVAAPQCGHGLHATPWWDERAPRPPTYDRRAHAERTCHVGYAQAVH